jgi:hypothetical protein
MLLPAVSFCVLASSIGSELRSQTGEWPVDVVALAAPIRLMDHILGFQERHSRREGSAPPTRSASRSASVACTERNREFGESTRAENAYRVPPPPPRKRLSLRHGGAEAHIRHQ